MFLVKRLHSIYETIAAGNNPECHHFWQAPSQNMFELCGWYGSDLMTVRPSPMFSIDQGQVSARAGHDECVHKCQKQTYTKHIGQSMLMFCTCLDHEVIIGWHLCQYEGRRSVMVPLYQCFPEAPKLVMYDFACGYGLHLSVAS